MNSVTGLPPIGLTGSGPQTALDHLLESPAAKIAALHAKADEDQTATRVLNPELDRDAFLQLLVLQLRNQDPLNPQDNQDMLAQLAQFSSLEQMNNLNDSFELLSGNLDQLNFISASGLVGRHVAGLDLNGLPRQGIVDSVHLDGSVVVLSVDGELMSMAGVLEVGQPEPKTVEKGK